MSVSNLITTGFAIGLMSLTLSACFKQPSENDNAPAITSSTNQVAQPSVATQPTGKTKNSQYNEDTNAKQRCNNSAIEKAYRAQNPTQKIQVLGCGQVIKILKDDNDGSRHQKFLVRIDGYPHITVLVAHNIDLASRIDNLKSQTPIQFYGEYIYNDKGGVVHWTHKDPAARHQDGWLNYQGQKYW